MSKLKSIKVLGNGKKKKKKLFKKISTIKIKRYE